MGKSSVEIVAVNVSTLAVEWIEIAFTTSGIMLHPVSTLAVEWIEICLRGGKSICLTRLHPRGGVD